VLLGALKFPVLPANQPFCLTLERAVAGYFCEAASGGSWRRAQSKAAPKGRSALPQQNGL
jgi:hypothetical protein